MGWIPMYLNDADVIELKDFLNSETDIAFLISNGLNKWKAINSIDQLPKGEITLWHIPSGSLPQTSGNTFLKRIGIKRWIHNPFEGWVDNHPLANEASPFFGAAWPEVIHLYIKAGTETEIGMSSFSWVGNHFAIIGTKADNRTMKYWQRLRRQIKKRSIPIPRSDKISNSDNIFAFTGALREIKNGKHRAINP